MSLIAKDGGETHFEPAPVGLHHAVCVDIVDLGLQETPFAADFARKLGSNSTALRLSRDIRCCKLASIEVAIGPPLMRSVRYYKGEVE